MNIRTKIAPLAVASLIATSSLLVLHNASAADATTESKDAVAKVTSEAKDQAIIKTVDEAYKGLREVRAARLAIFNGETAVATEFATAAEDDFKIAEKFRDSHGVTTKILTINHDVYIPFDMSIGLAEGFVVPEDKKSKLDEANRFLGHGSHKKAVEVLRLANIDVTVKTALMPVKASLAHVKDALKLLDEKKYYEANLALKALEDSVVFESYSVDALPEQGKKG